MLDDATSSKIDAQQFPVEHVSLYTSRAEITRTVNVSGVSAGLCDVTIERLPICLDTDSLRIEGASIGGSVTLHDVAVKRAPHKTAPTTSDELERLRADLKSKENALARTNTRIKALDEYLETLKVKHVNIAAVGEALAGYDEQAEKLQNRIAQLEREIDKAQDAVTAEEQRLSGTGFERDLANIAIVGLAIESNKPINIELKLTYAVSRASWSPRYDVRISTEGTVLPDGKSDASLAKVTFKAAISNHTGEAWEGAAVVLETSTPTLGRSPPQLRVWEVGVMRSQPYFPPGASALPPPPMATLRSVAPKMMMSMPAPGSASLPAPSPMAVAEAAVQSTGQATSFVVPGRVSIPSGGEHSVGVTVLDLPCELVRTVTPKLETSVHLRGKITNASEYALLPGRASVYLDSAFVSQSQIQSVSPGETFGCALSVDNSLRVKYSSKPRRSTTSGLVSRTRTTTLQSTITITNTSATRHIPSLRVLDQVPISTDEKVVVKLVSPVLPSLDTIEKDQPATWQRLSKSVSTRWASTDDDARDSDAPGESAPVGREGKIEWNVTLAPQAKVAFGIECTVAAPIDVNVSGL